MMGEHTKGPWELDDHKWRLVVSKPGDGFITREVCRTDASTMAAFEQQANARLIAAAPDLLAALEKVLNHPLIRMTGDAEVVVRAAISKARGQS